MRSSGRNESAALDPQVSFTRLGVVFAPGYDDAEREGTLNPASARTREGDLVLLPRVVAAGNVSRIARCSSSWDGDDVRFTREGFVLEPEAAYERRSEPGGYGCEDPRVTFIPKLDRYLMAYCAYGPAGARVAVATSHDAREWTRLGLIDFHGNEGFGDKDAAFFPDVVESPTGRSCFAILHRPTLSASIADGRGSVPNVLALPPSEREGICISYFPAELVLRDVRALLNVVEARAIMQPDGAWGAIKVGAGTPPVRVAAGWMFLYHGIDTAAGHERGVRPALRYRAGVAVLDARRPDIVTYRSPEPVFSPEVAEERRGIVDDVVFPTAIDPRPELDALAFDIYYGMGDSKIGRGRLRFQA